MRVGEASRCAIAGLAAVTPAAGFIHPLAGIPIGIVASIIGYYCILWRTRKGIDESLDVWAVHGMGGLWGALATGIFASLAINPGGADGLLWGGGLQFAKQLAGVAVVGAFAFAATWGLGKLVDYTIGLRVKEEEERIICQCMNVTDHEIERAVLEGASNYYQLQERTKLGTVCGQCRDAAVQLLNRYRDEHFKKDQMHDDD